MTHLPNPVFNAIDKISILKQFPLFSELNIEELEFLSNLTTIKSIAKHKYIYSTGQESISLYVLLKGTIKIGNTSEDDREVIKSILHPTALFGEGSLSMSTRNSFAKAIGGEVKYLEIETQGFKEMMKENFDFNLKVIDTLGAKIKNIENRLESLVFNDARTRIVGFIRENAKAFGMKIGFETLLKHSLTQQDIANFTGTSRQTVTSVLNDLKSTNQIYFKRKSILIRDLATLA